MKSLTQFVTEAADGKGDDSHRDRASHYAYMADKHSGHSGVHETLQKEHSQFDTIHHHHKKLAKMHADMSSEYAQLSSVHHNLWNESRKR